MSEEPKRREAAIYAAAKAHAAERGIDLTTSLSQQALVPDEFRWMRAAIAAYRCAR